MNFRHFSRICHHPEFQGSIFKGAPILEIHTASILVLFMVVKLQSAKMGWPLMAWHLHRMSTYLAN